MMCVCMQHASSASESQHNPKSLFRVLALGERLLTKKEFNEYALTENEMKETVRYATPSMLVSVIFVSEDEQRRR